MGPANYYRKFIPHFSEIMALLTDLTKSNVPHKIKWSPAAQKAFAQIKQVLCQEPVLYALDIGQTLILQTDAPGMAPGTVLTQEKEGIKHPITYTNRKLLEHKQKNSIIEQKC